MKTFHLFLRNYLDLPLLKNISCFSVFFSIPEIQLGLLTLKTVLPLENSPFLLKMKHPL